MEITDTGNALMYVSADVGGNMGLFLGASIISLTEILELSMDVLFSKFSRMRSPTTGVSPDQISNKDKF